MEPAHCFTDDEYTRDLEVHLVGGAVRDGLLGLVVKDRDWVVTGTTPELMVDRGFRPVGKDFPVFLHPVTHEEYALARTERNVGAGYHGFTWFADPTVTLEQDLARRDLTINAMAEDRRGKVIDPHQGQRDLARRELRHVSDAFAEDPVRVLRLARFAARFSDPPFTVHGSTLDLTRQMARSGEIASLVAERVWQELAAALPHPGFYRFIETLRDCDALAVILPEVDALFGVEQRPEHHPEIDSGVHTLLALQAAARLGASSIETFAVLTHDLGKALTPKGELPAHRGHERRGLAPINALCARLRVPAAYRQLALRVCEFHLLLHRLDELQPKTVLKLLENLDGFRNPEYVERFVRCCKADMQGRAGFETRPYPQANTLLDYRDAAAAVDSGVIASSVRNDAGSNAALGERIAAEIRRARVRAISIAKTAQRPAPSGG